MFNTIARIDLSKGSLNTIAPTPSKAPQNEKNGIKTKPKLI